MSNRQILSLCVWISLALIWMLECCLCAQTNSFPEFRLEAAREYLHFVSQMVQNQSNTNADVLFINARCESELGQIAEAERLARKALEFDPRRADIHLFLADLCIRQDRLEDAAKVLREALEANPQSKGIHCRLGMALERLGDIKGAESMLQIAVRTSPEDATARLLLGRMRLNKGQTVLAKVELEQACQLDPQSINARYALYQVQTQLGELEAAQKTLEIFRELKKKEKSAMDTVDVRNENEQDLRKYTAEFHTALASQLFRQGQEPIAEAHLRQAVRIAPPQYILAQELLVDFYLKKGRPMEAKPLLMEMVKLRPNDAVSHLNLSTVLLQLKDPDAERELKRVLELDAKQPQALHNLTRFYLNSRKQLPEALSLCQRLITVDPIAINYDLLGWAYFSNAKTNEAIQAAASAVEKDPNNAGYRLRLERLKQLIKPPPPN